MKKHWKYGHYFVWIGYLLLSFKGYTAEIFTDFLYWQPYQEGLTYALRFHPEGSSTQVLLKEIHFSFAPGYRLGVGTGRAQSDWNGLLVWVRYGNTSSATAHFDSRTFLSALWAPVDLGTSALWKAHAHWRLQYDVVDAELKRRYRLGRFFQIDPLMSLRGVRMSQHVRCQYDDVKSADGELFDLVVRGKNKYEGIGLRAGAEVFFPFNSHWEIFTGATGSLVYGSQEIKWRYVDVLRQNQDAHRSNLRPNMESLLGAIWHSAHWAFSLKYEWVVWFDGTGGKSLDENTEWGNLSLQGGSAALSFSF